MFQVVFSVGTMRFRHPAGACSAALILLACTFFAQPSFGQARRVVPLGASGKRVALVVGNDEYQSVPKLANGVRDAQAMRLALQGAGFQVQIATNVSREGIDAAVNKFILSINPGDIALFYYSGHAVQVGGENYLSPVDLVAANEVQVRNRSFKASEVIEEMEARGADLQIAILDACRNNPFARERSIGGGQGLAAMNVGRGTFLAYATAPGRTSDDNSSDRNGLYTTYLLKALAQPGLSLEQVFKQASAEVQSASNGKQIPWISSSVQGDFYFHMPAPPAPEVKPAPAPAVVAAQPAPPDPAAEAWAITRGKSNRAMLETIIKEFPDSPYARLAKVELAGLPSAPVSAPAMAPVRVNDSPKPERQADTLGQRTISAPNTPAVTPPPFTPTSVAPPVKTVERAKTAGPEELTQQGIASFNVRDYAKALPFFRAAANSGNAQAMYFLAYMYQHGLGVAADNAEAMRVYKNSAAGGYASSFSALGLMYENGSGVPVDYAEARKWLLKGIDAGSAASMNELGYMYFSGLGTRRDTAEGCRWYRKSAEGGFTSGLYNLGYCYETGEGVSADRAQAIELYRRAATAGSETAKQALQRLGAK
jgi:hypothetical protein